MNCKLSLLVSVLVLGASTTLSANDLAEAFKAGKVSGDISVTYENRSQDKEINAYYSDTAYSVGSVGIEYKTGDYQGFSAAFGARGYRALWEDESGDANERFNDNNVLISNAYVAFDNNIVHVKAGRQQLFTDWIKRTLDGVSVYVNPAKNLELELIWANQLGRVDNRNAIDSYDIGVDNKGVYKYALAYTFNDMFSAKVFGKTVPDSYDLYGGFVNVDAGNFGGRVQYIETKEDVLTANGEMLEVQAYAKFVGATATLGYIKTGDETGWGSAASNGELVVPFEEGDQIYGAHGSDTTYLMLSRSFSGVSLTALYGITNYEKANVDYDKSELDIWAGYGITKDLSVALGFTVTDEDTKDAATTDLTQLNFTASYKF